MNRFYMFFFFLLLLLSCQNKIDKKLITQEDYYGTIYFCVGSVTTITAVNCESFVDDLKYSIAYFKVVKHEFVKQLVEELKNQENSDLVDYIDVRYQIELADETVICFDRFGYYTVNGIIKGKYENFQSFLDYIEENKSRAEMLEELPILILE